jgi:modulator of FtsH protease HflC
MKFTLKAAIIGISVVILIVIYSGFYTLEEGQQAIVVQFGRPVGEPVTAAGLHIKLPFVQEVRRFEKRLLVWDGDPNQVPTKGREFIWVDTTARWRIADAKKFLENVASEAGAQSRLNDILDSVVRDQVSSSELVELVRSASWKAPEAEVLKEIPKERLPVGGRRSPGRYWLKPKRSSLSTASNWWMCASSASITWKACARRSMSA